MYRYDGDDYFRTTAVIGSKECEAIGYNVKNKIARDMVANAVTIPGTVVHFRIEKFLRKVKGAAPPEPIHWSEGAEKIIERWEKNNQITERLVMPAKEGFNGFLQFYNNPKWEYVDKDGERYSGIVPVLIEHNMFVDNFAGTGMRVAGTADLIARVWLKGQIEDDGYFHECKHHQPDDPLCTCTQRWVVTLMDWKYSQKKQAGHKEQLSCYHYMAQVTGAFDIATENGRYPINYENWSVLFKKPDHEVGYNLFKYKQDLSGFLDALEIMRNPRPITLNHRNYTYGLKGRCMFCQYQNNCPDRQTTSEEQTVYVDELSEGRYGVDAE